MLYGILAIYLEVVFFRHICKQDVYNFAEMASFILYDCPATINCVPWHLHTPRHLTADVNGPGLPCGFPIYHWSWCWQCTNDVIYVLKPQVHSWPSKWSNVSYLVWDLEMLECSLVWPPHFQCLVIETMKHRHFISKPLRRKLWIIVLWRTYLGFTVLLAVIDSCCNYVHSLTIQTSPASPAVASDTWLILSGNLSVHWGIVPSIMGNVGKGSLRCP